MDDKEKIVFHDRLNQIQSRINSTPKPHPNDTVENIYKLEQELIAKIGWKGEKIGYATALGLRLNADILNIIIDKLSPSN